MTTLASDNFDRADNANLGASWDSGYTGEAALKIVSNAVQDTTLGSTGIESYNAVSFPADQWAQATIGLWTGTVLRLAGVVVRAAAPATNTLYRFRAAGNSAIITSSINKVVAGATTTIASENATTWASTDTVYLEIRGSALVAKRNGISLLTGSDSAIASGRAGLTVFVNTTGATSDASLDDWSAGGFGHGLKLSYTRNQNVRTVY